MGRFMFLLGVFGALMLAMIPHLVWLVSTGVSRLFGNGVRYAPFGWTALSLVLAFWMILAYGFFLGQWNLKVKERTVQCRDLPSSFSGMRIVHVSDFHLSTFEGKPRQLKRFVDAINAQDADIVCFTGDLVTMSPDELLPNVDVLRMVNARHGVFSVLGNHDMLIYSRGSSESERLEEVERLAQMERDSLGWNLLRNESFRIQSEAGETVAIIGVDNKNVSGQGFRTIDCGDLDSAMEGTEGFRILLTHDPGHWDAEVLGKTDIQLTLSGHTHAAQIRIFGWSPASWMFRRVYGLYEEKGQFLHVNPGLGCTLPFRFGARPEVSVLRIVAQ